MSDASEPAFGRFGKTAAEKIAAMETERFFAERRARAQKIPPSYQCRRAHPFLRCAASSAAR